MPQNIFSTFKNPDGYPTETVQEWFQAIYEMIVVEEALRDESNCENWSPIDNYEIYRTEKGNRDDVVASYTSTNKENIPPWFSREKQENILGRKCRFHP